MADHLTKEERSSLMGRVAGKNTKPEMVVLESNQTLIALAALDNLVKGASGQAVQCANLMTGQPEDTALREPAALP